MIKHEVGTVKVWQNIMKYKRRQNLFDENTNPLQSKENVKGTVLLEYNGFDKWILNEFNM